VNQAPTGKIHRLSGKFSHNASKIYKGFQIEGKNHVQKVSVSL
jgi:hypothetical protein